MFHFLSISLVEPSPIFCPSHIDYQIWKLKKDEENILKINAKIDRNFINTDNVTEKNYRDIEKSKIEVLIPDGVLKCECEKLAYDLGFSKRVHFLGIRLIFS